MSGRSHQRRQFLEALGAGATALPFLRLLESSAVQAGGTARPLRLLALCAGFGRLAPWIAARSRWTNVHTVGPGGLLSFLQFRQ